MKRFRLVHLKSTTDLREAASQWDDLWRRSSVTTPTARAELVAQWIEQFARDKEFHAIAVEDDRQWLALLPLVGTRVKRFLTAGTLCGGSWVPGGSFLLDEAAAAEDVLDLLVQGIRELPWQLLWLDHAAISSARWKIFRDAVVRAGVNCDVQKEYEIGLVDISHDWQAYRSRWSRNHRRNMTRYGRELSGIGGRFDLHAQLAPDQIEEQMRRAFEIENLSWKGDAGSSVFGRGQFPFVLRQARQLAEWGQLELSFLHTEDGPVAFCYGFRAKGVCHTCKIGFDPDSPQARLGPSKLLFHDLLERLHGDQECRALDFFGPLTSATGNWKPDPYPVGRVIVAPRRTLGRLALWTYGQLRRRKMSRNGQDAAPVPQGGPRH